MQSSADAVAQRPATVSPDGGALDSGPSQTLLGTLGICCGTGCRRDHRACQSIEPQNRGKSEFHVDLPSIFEFHTDIVAVMSASPAKSIGNRKMHHLERQGYM